MSVTWTDLPESVMATLRDGIVIPAHPLALDAHGAFDRRRQRALTRYYVDAGAGGLAVGVHATQFEIRDHGLYEPVLRLAAEAADEWTDRPLVRIAGLAGDTRQARQEAAIAVDLGYHAGLLSLAALRGANEDTLIEHCRAIAGDMPLIGFYLQPAVGGIPLGRDFWRRFAEIDNVIAIKVAPFDRYATLDVMAGIVAAGAEDRISLYTGNDDHILLDLVTPFQVRRGDDLVDLRFVGGLLGHWSVWTQSAVALLARAKADVADGRISAELLALDSRITDCNAAIFDVANAFKGCIAGCNEVLRRQGLLASNRCLNLDESLGPGQQEEIDRVYRDHPDLNDDAFVAANLDRWLS